MTIQYGTPRKLVGLDIFTKGQNPVFFKAENGKEAESFINNAKQARILEGVIPIWAEDPEMKLVTRL